MMKDRRLLWLAMAGAVAGAMGDVLLLYNPDGGFLSGKYDYLAVISQNRLIAGHFLGILGIPFEILGLVYLAAKIKPHVQSWTNWILPIGVFTFFPGVVYHGCLAFVAHIVRSQPDLLPSLTIFFEPLAVILILNYAVVSILLSLAIHKGYLPLPQWLAYLNPLIIWILLLLPYFIIPPIGNVTAPAAFNLSMLVFIALAAKFER